ncbi:MAG: hypothetical protein JO015_02910 [Verrucomicrobia bacterium]|nr:hypothetical protein [Verrucomicrobiota bacterium]
MPQESHIPPVARDGQHPLPDTDRLISREEEAERALKKTAFTRGTRCLLVTLFLLTIGTWPAVQIITELRTSGTDDALPMLDLLKLLPSWSKICGVRSLADLGHLAPDAEEIKAVEKGVQDKSAFAQWLLPRMQAVLTGILRIGNEQAYVGRNRWLFYRPDVEYVTGPPFLDPAQLKERARQAGIQPDPVKGIVDFRNQLARRAIDLVVMPVPVEPCVDGEMLALNLRQENAGALQNGSFEDFKARLGAEGVRVFDPGPLLRARKHALGGAPLFLETDTHWRPETMEFVAGQLAAFLNASPATATPTNAFRIAEKEVAGLGDLFTMLRLPAQQNVYLPQKVAIRQILAGNAMWHPSKQAGVLLLGDSFCNIFSFGSMGWGESAGFAEHLSRALGGQPLDCILRNSDASYATREILSSELARGRDPLAGKKVVVWAFAARELAFGNWKLLPLKTGKPQPFQFFNPKSGEESVVTGTVEAISGVPLPGSVPYKDHTLTLHLVDVTGPSQPPSEPLQALVCLWSMRDNVWMPAARLRFGDRVTVRLRAWADVATQYEKINRSELDDAVLELEEPAWGELVGHGQGRDLHPFSAALSH